MFAGDRQATEIPRNHRVRDAFPATSVGSLPDISILESYPTREFGFDMGVYDEPDGLRELTAQTAPLFCLSAERGETAYETQVSLSIQRRPDGAPEGAEGAISQQ